jgi:hypothetical protein
LDHIRYSLLDFIVPLKSEVRLMNPAKSKSDNSEYQVSMVEIDECTAVAKNQI